MLVLRLRVVVVLLALAMLSLCLPVPRAAAQSCGGLPGESRLLVDTYAASGTYIFSPTPNPAICYFFHSLGSDTYTVTLGAANYPQTGDVYFMGNLFDGVITAGDSVELWQVLPDTTPTITPLPTSTTLPNCDVQRLGMYSGENIVWFYDTINVSQGYDYIKWDFVPTGNANFALVLNGSLNINPYTEWHAEFRFDGGYTTIGLQAATFFPGTADISFLLCHDAVVETSTPTPTLTPTSTSTPTFLPTATNLPTPLPNQGTCVLLGATNTGTQYLLHRVGDLFGYTFRISTPLGPEQTIAVDALAIDGTTVHNDINNNVFYAINRHTVYVDWSDSAFFGVQLCSGVTVPPTRTPLPPFSTLSPTATSTPTSTPTGTLLPTSTSTATYTPVPTPTTPPTCLTPENEDSGECTIINLQQTQIALQQTQIAQGNLATVVIPTSAATPEPNIAGAIGIICERDPCASIGVVSDGVSQIIDKLQANQEAPDCSAAFADLPDTGGGWALDMAGVAAPFCAVVEMTTYYREWLRVISVFFSALMAYGYYKLTMRRMGDV